MSADTAIFEAERPALNALCYRMLGERAGAEDMPEEAERKGLGTPATRAAILEKLVQMGFVQRKGKQLVPTKDGINLAVVLPESLTSPALTAEWENRLTEIAKGNADPDEFMAEIEAQVSQLVKTYSCADYYAPGKSYAGWCDQECGYGQCAAPSSLRLEPRGAPN